MHNLPFADLPLLLSYTGTEQGAAHHFQAKRQRNAGRRDEEGAQPVFSPSEQFITQVKFRELREQRDKSLAAYDQLARTAANAHDDVSRLRLLYAGLREMQFAKQPLHPDVGNLELILRQGDGSQASFGLSLIHISEPTRLMSISYAVFCL